MCLFVCVSHFVSQVPQPTCSWKWMRDILAILCWHPDTCQLGNPTTFWLSFNCESWIRISIQFEVSTGGAKRDVGKPPNVPAWNVSWSDHPKSTAHSAEQDIVNLTSNEGNCFWGSYVWAKNTQHLPCSRRPLVGKVDNVAGGHILSGFLNEVQCVVDIQQLISFNQSNPKGCHLWIMSKGHM